MIMNLFIYSSKWESRWPITSDLKLSNAERHKRRQMTSNLMCSFHVRTASDVQCLDLNKLDRKAWTTTRNAGTTDLRLDLGVSHMSNIHKQRRLVVNCQRLVVSGFLWPGIAFRRVFHSWLGSGVFWCSGFPGYSASERDSNNRSVINLVAFLSVYWFRICNWHRHTVLDT